MPRENRKRGKKHKKHTEQDSPPDSVDHAKHTTDTVPSQPSWIVPAPDREDFNPEAPFGYVDADVKAYFRTVDVQIRNWQESGAALEANGDVDPNEERHLFFMAALSEMSEKELQLATDPDCSIVLERMVYSMDDFTRRVFMDKFTGSYEVLAKHRFASHVCQTLFTVASETVSREYRGILPTIAALPHQGELRTLTQLVLDCCEELLPHFTSLIMDPFGSHVMRAVILLLSPYLSTSVGNSQATIRSKKSAAWKAKQGPLKSVFSGDAGNNSEKNVPNDFRVFSRKFLNTLRSTLSENEVRALAASKVASPVLQMLLEVEANECMHDEPGSLMDRVLVGVITSCHDSDAASPELSDYVDTLLRDQTSSHLLETVVFRSPSKAFLVIWATYFRGRLGRLAVHPVANFIVAKAIERASQEQLVEVCTELKDAWPRVIRSSRSGVLKALIERGVALNCLGSEIEESVYSAFELKKTVDRDQLVPCAVCLLPLSDYARVTTKSNREAVKKEKRGSDKADDPLEPKIQGALLLQSMLLLPEPHNLSIVKSIAAQSIEHTIKLAHHPAGSRILDALLDSPSVPFKSKRQFILSFIGHYHVLVDDRIGSRVGDRCWNFADTYLKEKIARSLITFDTTLAASYYGKYFARNLNIHLLKRKPEEWKEIQSERRRATHQQTTANAKQQSHAVLENQRVSKASQPPVEGSPSIPVLVEPTTKSRNKKRKERETDEIDALFETTLGKKVKRGALDDSESGIHSAVLHQNDMTVSQNTGLASVMCAIRAAPKDEKGLRRDGKRKKPW